MARQGSLCLPIFASRWHLAALGSLCVLIFAQLSVSHAASPPTIANDLVDLRLHYQWETPTPRFWDVAIRVIDDAGPARAISEVENHSTSARTTGAIEASANEVIFRPRHAMQSGALELRVVASRDAKLAIHIQSSAHRDGSKNTRRVTREISLIELIETGSIRGANSDPADNPDWSLSRVAEDGLRMENDGDSNFYWPGEDFHFRVQTNQWIEFASQSLTLQYSLYRVSSGEAVSSRRWPLNIDSWGNSNPIEIRDQTPTQPGVYEIRCEVTKEDENIWKRFRRRESPLRRIGHPIVVALPHDSEQAEGHSDSKPVWRTVGSLRPADSTWSVGKWLPEQTTRLIPGQAASSQPGLPKQAYAGEQLALIKKNGVFQATLPVMTPGYPHKITLRVPTDRSLNVRVEIAGPHGRTNPILAFAIATDADPSQGKWATHTFVHYPKSSEDQIWVTNQDDSSAMAFESVTVVAGPSQLSTESQRSPDSKRSVALRVTNFDWVNSLTNDVAARSHLRRCTAETTSMYRMWVATRRLRDFAIASGMNGVVIPTGADGRTNYSTTFYHPSRSSDARLGGSRRESESLADLMRLLAQPDFEIHIALKPDMLLSSVEKTLRENSSMTRVLTRVQRGAGDQYNILHPAVQRELVAVVDELKQQCQVSSSFAGVVLDCRTGSHLAPRQDAASDSTTLMLFARSSDRIAGPSLLEWVQNDGEAEFDRWIQNQTATVFHTIASKVAGKSLLVRSGVELASVEEPALNRSPNLFSVIDFRCGSSRCWATKQPSISLPLVTEVTTLPIAAVISRPRDHGNDLDNNDFGDKPAVDKDVDGSVVLESLRTQIAKDACRVIDHTDPTILLIDDTLLGSRLDIDLKRVLTSVSNLPARDRLNPVAPVDPAAQTVHVNSGRSVEGHLFVAVTNLAPWTSVVEFADSGVQWSQVGSDLQSKQATKLETIGSRIRLTLPAGRMAILKTNALVPDHIHFAAWSVRLGGGVAALDLIKSNVTAIVERIGTLADLDPSGLLRNGGFEQSGGMGLVGWLHAQHPPGCVQIDESESTEGKHSVRMTTDAVAGTRTWLVSETIDPPESGRLAVSLACRAEARDDNSVHQLRVSIEATRQGTPIRYASDFEAIRDGRWADRAIVLEIEGIDPTSVDSLRLTIDSLSGGKVWIDDVRLHDQFPTTNERSELQSQAFLAVQGLQRGSLTPSARLLQNDWARYLLTLTPPESPKPAAETIKPAVATPGVAERIRNWLPKPLRF